jgi:hypothetical protein
MHDAAVNNHTDRHPAQTHADEAGKRDRSISNFCAQPDPEKIEKNHKQNEPEDYGQTGHNVNNERRYHDVS